MTLNASAGDLDLEDGDEAEGEAVAVVDQERESIFWKGHGGGSL